MLTELEKSQIRQLTASPQWKTIERLTELYIKNIRENSPIRDTIDGTVIETLMQEGKIRGIRDFLKLLIDECQ